MVAVPVLLYAKGSVTGVVVNKETGDPMDFVTVQVVDSKTNKPLNISVSTADDGSFRLPSLPDGSYVVRVMNVGSVNQDRPVDVAGADIDLGVIKLADDSKPDAFRT